jgi:hypothetical protein
MFNIDNLGSKKGKKQKEPPPKPVKSLTSKPPTHDHRKDIEYWWISDCDETDFLSLVIQISNFLMTM